MTTYVSLGPRVGTTLVGAAGPIVAPDPNNKIAAGNWTATFHPDDINCQMPYFEVCHIVLNGAPGSTFQVWIDAFQWDTNQNGTSNSWDPSVAMPMRPGQFLYFYWSNPGTDTNPPSVTLWLRYDQDIIANQKSLLGLAAQ
jgi:hypothetical protein